jgi:hypothetical protein
MSISVAAQCRSASYMPLGTDTDTDSSPHESMRDIKHKDRRYSLDTDSGLLVMRDHHSGDDIDNWPASDLSAASAQIPQCAPD